MLANSARKKRKKTTPCGVTLTRSLVTYQAAQITKQTAIQVGGKEGGGVTWSPGGRLCGAAASRAGPWCWPPLSPPAGCPSSSATQTSCTAPAAPHSTETVCRYGWVHYMRQMLISSDLHTLLSMQIQLRFSSRLSLWLLQWKPLCCRHTPWTGVCIVLGANARFR